MAGHRPNRRLVGPRPGNESAEGQIIWIDGAAGKRTQEKTENETNETVGEG